MLLWAIGGVVYMILIHGLACCAENRIGLHPISTHRHTPTAKLISSKKSFKNVCISV